VKELAMREIGQIVRLQVQRDGLKQGSGANRCYDPANIVSVAALRLESDGAWGLSEGAEILDVHNRLHPHSKNRGDNSFNVNFTGHYQRMQQRFGPHLTLGQAGENITIAYDGIVTLAEISDGIWLEAADGQLAHIGPAVVARPCEPFTTFALALSDRPVAAMMKEALQFLDDGTRGFNLSLAGGPVEVRLGGRAYLPDRP
jgi:hypothetical protein